ncbi:MAG: hypothetical protein A2234_09640 [Elusimicrobia bacterium RIFOXYA2_FULL_58_8]|nr:MAG: hypothetical protein A2285_06930 [Elusimicrobia bacterium RIFOXYA12_FULL_57_11]OGS14054.1 MAG: hypothetical protein A2234_09640 [Elusimicrobia bacterium RIFOXYA2_FULL_58_8]
MKKTLLAVFTVLAVITAGAGAQDFSFDQLSVNPPQPAAVSGPAAVAPAPVKAGVQREWLVMVFINGVNDLGILGFADKSVNDMEKVGSTPGMAVVAEYGVLGQDGSADRNLKFQRGSRTLYITQDADAANITSPVIYSSNDADMGSAANLVRFAKRAIRRYPAKKTAVILWNHGDGRMGIAYDDVSSNHMEVDQLGRALGQIKQALGRNIDVFATDACLMQTAEVAYELKDSVDVIVGSEEVIPVDSFPYDAFLGPLAANPGVGAEAVGRSIVDTYGAYYTSGGTLSALRSSALGGFVSNLNTWLGAVAGDPQAFQAAASPAVVAATYKFPADYYRADSRDLHDYISNVNGALINSPAARAAGVALQDYMTNNLIIRATVLPGMLNTHGLAIYLPDLRYNSANYEKLAFAADSDWDDFLRLVMEERLK